MTAELWLPGATRVPQQQDGGSMVGGPARVVWHTTESDAGSIAGATAWLVREQTFPHLIWDPSTGEVRQFIPADRAARALMHPAGTPETNRAGSLCVQIEVVGRAANPFTARPMRGLAPITAWLGALGIRCAYAVPGRMGWNSWANFGGHCGHIHVPGNDHVDPGAIDFNVLLVPTQPAEDDDMTLLERRSTDGAWFAIPTDLSHKEHILDTATLGRLQADTAHYRTDGLSDAQINAIPDANGGTA